MEPDPLPVLDPPGGSGMIRAMSDHGHTHSIARSNVLRERGRRLTPQRAVIWDILSAEPDRHLSAEEIAEHVRGQLPQVNASTVYRTLDLLVEDGLVLRTDLGENRAYFEPSHEHPHHHLVCERCGRVDHVHDDVLAGVSERVRERSGFEISVREVTFHGVCRDCAAPVSTEEEATMSEHNHDEPHTHEHSHGDTTHAHPHTGHEHDHTEHEHEHSHGAETHSHPHAHEAGDEADHSHKHDSD